MCRVDGATVNSSRSELLAKDRIPLCSVSSFSANIIFSSPSLFSFLVHFFFARVWALKQADIARPGPSLSVASHLPGKGVGMGRFLLKVRLNPKADFC